MDGESEMMAPEGKSCSLNENWVKVLGIVVWWGVNAEFDLN